MRASWARRRSPPTERGPGGRPPAARSARAAVSYGRHEGRTFGASGPADTPGSVPRALARHRLDGHLSRGHVAVTLQRPTRERDGQPHRSLSGLAPDEVYRADRVTAAAGGLLPHRFTLTPGFRPRRSAFCGTVSRVAPGGCYPPSCPAEPGRSSAHDRDRATRPSCRPARGSSLPGGAAVSVRTPRAELSAPNQRPDSSVRTRMRSHSGHCRTSSGADRRTTSRSEPVSVIVQPLHVRCRSRAAPTPPPRVRRCS